jgi:hypothetical protein
LASCQSRSSHPPESGLQGAAEVGQIPGAARVVGGGGLDPPARGDGLAEVGQIPDPPEPDPQGDTEVGQIPGAARVAGRCGIDRCPQPGHGLSQRSHIRSPVRILQNLYRSGVKPTGVAGGGTSQSVTDRFGDEMGSRRQPSGGGRPSPSSRRSGGEEAGAADPGGAGEAGAALTKPGRASTVRWCGSGERDGEEYARNRRCYVSQFDTGSNLTDLGWLRCALAVMVVAVGNGRCTSWR